MGARGSHFKQWRNRLDQSFKKVTVAGNLVWLKYRVQNGAGKTTLEKLAKARFPGQEIQKSLSVQKFF